MPITYYHDAPIQMPVDLARRAGQYAGQAEIAKEQRATQQRNVERIQEMAFREQQASYDRDLQVQKMQQDALARQQQMDFQKEMARQQQEASLNQMMVANDFERAGMLQKEKAKKESLGYTYTAEDAKRMQELKAAIQRVQSADNLTPIQKAQAVAGLQSELSGMMPTEAPYKGNLTDDQLYELETKGGYIVTDATTGERTRYMKDGQGGLMMDEKFAQQETQVKIAKIQNEFKKEESARKDVIAKQKEEAEKQKEARKEKADRRKMYDDNIKSLQREVDDEEIRLRTAQRDVWEIERDWAKDKREAIKNARDYAGRLDQSLVNAENGRLNAMYGPMLESAKSALGGIERSLSAANQRLDATRQERDRAFAQQSEEAEPGQLPDVGFEVQNQQAIQQQQMVQQAQNAQREQTAMQKFMESPTWIYNANVKSIVKNPELSIEHGKDIQATMRALAQQPGGIPQKLLKAAKEFDDAVAEELARKFKESMSVEDAKRIWQKNNEDKKRINRSHMAFVRYQRDKEKQDQYKQWQKNRLSSL